MVSAAGGVNSAAPSVAGSGAPAASADGPQPRFRLGFRLRFRGQLGDAGLLPRLVGRSLFGRLRRARPLGDRLGRRRRRAGSIDSSAATSAGTAAAVSAKGSAAPPWPRTAPPRRPRRSARRRPGGRGRAVRRGAPRRPSANRARSSPRAGRARRGRCGSADQPEPDAQQGDRDDHEDRREHEDRRGRGEDAGAGTPWIIAGSSLVRRAPHRRPVTDPPRDKGVPSRSHRPRRSARRATAPRCGCRRAGASPAAVGGSPSAAPRPRRRTATGRPVRVDPRPPEHLVDEHVAEPCDRALVEQHRLHRRPRRASAAARTDAGQRQRIGSQPLDVGADHDAGQTPRVVEPERHAARHCDHPAVPPRVVGPAAVGELADRATSSRASDPSSRSARRREPARRGRRCR